MNKKKKTKDRKKAIPMVWSCLHQHQPVMGSCISRIIFLPQPSTTTPAANCRRVTLKPRRNLGTEMATKLARSGKGNDTWVLKFDAAKELKQCPIHGDLEQLLNETSEKRGQFQQHLSVCLSLRTQLGDAAKISGQTESTTRWWKIMGIMRSSARCRTTCCGTFLENGNDQG